MENCKNVTIFVSVSYVKAAKKTQLCALEQCLVTRGTLARNMSTILKR